MQASPLTTARVAVRTGLAAAAGSGALLLLWAFRLIPDGRPVLVLMVYLALIAAAAGGGIVAAVASCHMAVGRAFSAGMRAGQAAGGFAPAWERPREQAPNLRAVK